MKYEIEGIKVYFELDWRWMCHDWNDEYGTVQIGTYPELQDYPIWDHSLYSFEENWIIAVWLINNLNKIEQTLWTL